MRSQGRASALATAVIICLLAGCGKEQQAAPPAEQEVRLGYFANVTHAQAVLGVHSGQFARAVAPARLTTRMFNAGPSLIESLFAGEIDVGYIGPGPAITGHSRSRGQGVRVVAGAAANGAVIVARRGAGIRSLSDLKGKRIATPQLANTQDISARYFLKRVLGLSDLSNVIPVPNAEQSAMMVRGQIDAAWVPEPWGSRLVAEADAELIAQEKDIRDLWPSGELALTVVITSPKFMHERREMLKKILAVHAAITAQLASNSQALAGDLNAALEKLTGKRLPAGVLEQSLRHVSFTTRPLEHTLRAMADWSYDLGFAKEPISIEGLVDWSLMSQVVAEMERNSAASQPGQR